METVRLTNMCMIYDDDNNVLVQDRVKKNWPGITFPGGHVEKGESIIHSVIREVKEETGLDIENLQICGLKDWYNPFDNTRYLVFLFKTKVFKGTLTSSDEGKVFWIKRDEMKNYKLANDFDRMLEVFYNENVNESFYCYEDNDWKIHCY